MILIEDVIRLLTSIIIMAFTAYVLTHLSNFFPQFFASVSRKHKLKSNLEIDYNKDYNALTNRFNKTPNKKEVKKNHGKRIPFFNK